MKLTRKTLALMLMFCIVLTLFVPFSAFATVTSPIGQWDFDSDELSDNSAFGWAPVVSGTQNITTGILGKKGTAWKITHNKDEEVGITLGKLPSSFVGAKQITLSAWIKREGAVDGQRNGWVDDWQTVFELHNADMNKIICNAKFGDYNDTWSPFSPLLNDNDTVTTGKLPADSSYNLSENEFHHMAVVIDFSNSDDSKFYFYIDGVLWKSYGFDEDYKFDANWVGCENGFPEGTMLYLGSNKSLKRQFNGLIDEVQVYDTALSEEQVAELYQSYPISPVGLWDFNNNTLTNSAKGLEWATPVVTSNEEHNPVTKGHTGIKEDAWRVRKIDFYGESADYDSGINLGALPDVLADSKTLTVSAWVKPEGFADFETIYELYNTNTSQIICTVRFGDYNSPAPFAPMLNDNNNFANGKLENSDYTVSQDEFHHIVTVLDFSDTANCKSAFYVDGILWQSYGLDGEYPMDGSWFGCGNGFPAGTTLYVGSNNKLRRQFNGMIDDVQVYAAALSADEIAKLYNSYVPAQATVSDDNCQLGAPVTFGEDNTVALNVFGVVNGIDTSYTIEDTVDGVFRSDYMRVSGIPSGLYVSGIQTDENTATVSFGGTADLPLINDATLNIVVYPMLTTNAGANSEAVSVYVKHDTYDFAALAGAAVNDENKYTVTLQPGTYQGESVNVIVAVYNDKYILKDMSVQNYPITEENITVLTESLNYTQGDMIRLFAWSDISGVKPVKLFNLN